MNLPRLTLRHLSGSAYRTAAIFLLVCLLTGTTLATTLVLRGAQDSVRLALTRLGADVVVVPLGAEGRVESALLTGMPTGVWMSREVVQELAQVPGVATVSPQLYLSGIVVDGGAGASLVAFDPDSDFTVLPWLGEGSPSELAPGEVIAGSRVAATAGGRLTVLGQPLRVAGRLDATGAGLDSTVFLTFADVEVLAQAGRLPGVPANSVSAVLIQTDAGSTPEDVAVRIMQGIPGVVPIESPDLFQSFRRQLVGLLRGMVAALGITWGLAIVLVGLIFSMTVNARRREIGVLRALGATKALVLGSLLSEAATIALAGGVAGLLLGTTVTYVLQQRIGTSLGLPFLFPSLAQLLPLIGAGLSLVTIAVLMAAVVPVSRIVGLDPVAAMRD